MIPKFSTVCSCIHTMPLRSYYFFVILFELVTYHLQTNPSLGKVKTFVTLIKDLVWSVLYESSMDNIVML